MNRRSSQIIAAVCAVGLSPILGADPIATPVAVTASSLQPFPVYSGRGGIKGYYVASGYMGDLGNLVMSGAYIPTHDGTGTPLRVTYRPKGPKGWAGLYWQNPANNWGEREGKAGFDLTGAQRLIFWARGENGGEKIREVRVGGISGRFPDSDVARKGPIKLTKEWQRFEIELKEKDLKHIIGGFGFSINKYDNPGETVFYLDDIHYELPPGAAPVASMAGAAPVSAPMVAPPSPSKDIQIKAEDAGLRVSVSSQLLFDSGKSGLKPSSKRLVSQIIELLKAYPVNDALIEGHTDSQGGSEFNLKLSRLRAESVRSTLIQEGGFNPERFEVVGYGKTRPIGDNATAAGRAVNRRVEVIILKTGENLPAKVEPIDNVAPPPEKANEQ